MGQPLGTVTGTLGRVSALRELTVQGGLQTRHQEPVTQGSRAGVEGLIAQEGKQTVSQAKVEEDT